MNLRIFKSNTTPEVKIVVQNNKLKSVQKKKIKKNCCCLFFIVIIEILFDHSLRYSDYRDNELENN